MERGIEGTIDTLYLEARHFDKSRYLFIRIEGFVRGIHKESAGIVYIGDR